LAQAFALDESEMAQRLMGYARTEPTISSRSWRQRGRGGGEAFVICDDAVVPIAGQGPVQGKRKN